MLPSFRPGQLQPFARATSEDGSTYRHARVGQCSGMTLRRCRSRVCSSQGERSQSVACFARLWLGGDRGRVCVGGAIHFESRPSRSNGANRPPCAAQPKARLRLWSRKRPAVWASPAAG
jgi:hypothetical protein